MCSSKLSTLILTLASVLSGAVFTVLAFLNLITSFLLGPWLAIALGAFSIAVLTLAATSLLRQDKQMNACICERGIRLLLSALALIAVSAFAVLFALTNLIISLLLVFIIATLFVFTLLSLYGLLACVIRSGCNCNCSC